MIKKLLALTLPFLLVIISLASSRAIAQQPSPTDDIPSDLTLDLSLAQQNSSPDQQIIVNAEVKQAQVESNNGTTTTTVPKDDVVSQAKTEPAKNAINPEQTTSEQVIIVPTVVPTAEVTTSPSIDQNQATSPTPDNTSPSPSGANLIPGTTVISPDDNAAPIDNSPNPSATIQPMAPQTSPTDNSKPQGSPSPDNSTNTAPSQPAPSQNIPSGSQPQATPTTDNSTPTQNNSTPAQDNGTPAQDSSQPTPDNSVDSSSVQGAATGPNIIKTIQQIIKNLFGIFNHK